jgi:NAD+ diphosphatase
MQSLVIMHVLREKLARRATTALTTYPVRVTLDRLALSRSTVDRAAARRTDPRLVEKLFADPATAVLLVDGEQAPITQTPHGPELAFIDPVTALAFAARAWDPKAQVERFYLGRDRADHEYAALVRPTPPLKGSGLPKGPAAVPAQPEHALPGTRWAGLREIGGLLDDTGAGLFTAALAMAHWHAGHRFCARCGSPTEPVQSGWSRACPNCGAEHFPRTDAAVIMAITDDRDRILLGRQASWHERRYSCLAGFVEPGESLEAAVRREACEEAGIAVEAVEYRGSQPWPFPASLMMGFRARAASTEITVDGKELASARWWTREELGLDIATGELSLPPVVSIARRLVEDWFGGPLNDGGDPWR